jgi:hypothetical protein
VYDIRRSKDCGLVTSGEDIRRYVTVASNLFMVFTSGYAREFVVEKSLAVSGYGRVRMSKWAPGTAWTKALSKWTNAT